MTDSRKRQPAIDEAPHAFPEDATVLAAPRQRAMPEPPYLESKEPQRIAIHKLAALTVKVLGLSSRKAIRLFNHDR